VGQRLGEVTFREKTAPGKQKLSLPDAKNNEAT
jgi:hypothetical protein